MAVAIIINPLSGGASPAKGRRRAELAADALATCGEEADIFVTERRGHAMELAAAEAKRGARLVIAWGGDGTVNEVGSALVGSGTPPRDAAERLGITEETARTVLKRVFAKVGISRQSDLTALLAKAVLR